MIRLSKIEIGASENDCWLWKGSVNQDGYGVARFDNKPILAHRLAYILFYGSIEKGMHIDHLCYVRNCVNPAHLEQVTPQQNSERMGEHLRKSRYSVID